MGRVRLHERSERRDGSRTVVERDGLAAVPLDGRRDRAAVPAERRRRHRRSVRDGSIRARGTARADGTDHGGGFGDSTRRGQRGRFPVGRPVRDQRQRRTGPISWRRSRRRPRSRCSAARCRVTAVLADRLSPLAAQGRLAGWARDDDEQALLEAIHLSGAMPDLAGGDGVAIVLNNAGGNRLDVYLERELDYDATVDTDTGEVTATATVTLTNNCTVERPPRQRDRRRGRRRGRRPGTNRTLCRCTARCRSSRRPSPRARAADPAGDRRAGAVRIRAGHRGGLAGRIRARRDPTGRVGHLSAVRTGGNAAAARRLHPRRPAATDRRRRGATPPRHVRPTASP